ncbi:MAG TPA: ABC transporter ATP-binding protein [Planctomycetota bacterium]|nr:ABC transporter ATP-binding protein [Planctomycetota bacterium]
MIVATKPLLVADNLRATYPGGIRALNGVSVSVAHGEFVALIGPNGSGKSTLLRCLSGMMKADAGSVELDGAAVCGLEAIDRARRIAYVQQMVSTPEYMTALEFTLLGRYAHLKGWRVYSRHDYAVAEGALRRAGALDFRERLMTELAGGERQRVILARALAQEAPVILLDEPTSALDAQHQILICELIRRMREEEGKTIVAATHDLNLASQFADRLYLLNAGTVAGQGTPDETLTQKCLESVYGIEVAHGYFEETIDGTRRPWVLPRAKGGGWRVEGGGKKNGDQSAIPSSLLPPPSSQNF